jgi:signal transduction histidine kinase
MELMRDVTESKELENRILEANRQLIALNAISGTLSQSLSLDVILNSALDKTLEVIEAEIGGILLLDEKSQMLSYGVHRGLSDEFVRGIASLALGEGIAGQVAERGETLVVDDISRDPRVTRSVVAEEGLKAFVSVPLKYKERIVGVLNIASRRPRPFPEQQVQLLTAVGHQLAIAIENARLYEALQLREQMRAELLRQIISAQEDERRRVARGLHDVTSQALATLAVRLEALAAGPRSSAKDIETQLEEIKSLLAATSKEVHGMIYDLRPSLLDDLGLPAALRSCAHNSLDAAGIEVHVEVVGQEERLPPQVEITLFRIVQEAISNIAYHARAESTYISLEFKEKSVAVQVEDDGIGFDFSQGFSSAGAKQSVGLLGMKERAELLGGTLTIDTKPGGGTRVAVEIPVDWGQGDV